MGLPRSLRIYAHLCSFGQAARGRIGLFQSNGTQRRT